MKYNFINCLIFGKKNYFPQYLEKTNYILYYNYEIIIYFHAWSKSMTLHYSLSIIFQKAFMLKQLLMMMVFQFIEDEMMDKL